MKTETPIGFEQLGLSPFLLNYLNKRGLSTPTPIQAQSIPFALQQKDIIGIAQTGTGKTLAFLLPILEMIQKTKGQALILIPTRELAYQVHDELKRIQTTFPVTCALVIGGTPYQRQTQQLKQNVNIIIATPGRLIDHLEKKHADLSRISCLVLDEADRMLDMGFKPQIEKIMKTLPQKKQTLLFSATMPSSIKSLIQTYIKNPQYIEITRAGSVGTDIDQTFYALKQEEKLSLLVHFLKTHQGSVLVFTRTKYGAKKITKQLNDLGYFADELHSNRTQQQRKKAIDRFKQKKSRLLIATEIAARGIHVNEIELVINFDIPENLDDYVHRIGRTGRAGKKGKAFTFVTHSQKWKLKQIEKLIKQKCQITPLPEFEHTIIKPSEKTYTHREKSSNQKQNMRQKKNASSHRKKRPFKPYRKFSKNKRTNSISVSQ